MCCNARKSRKSGSLRKPRRNNGVERRSLLAKRDTHWACPHRIHRRIGPVESRNNKCADPKHCLAKWWRRRQRRREARAAAKIGKGFCGTGRTKGNQTGRSGRGKADFNFGQERNSITDAEAKDSTDSYAQADSRDQGDSEADTKTHAEADTKTNSQTKTFSEENDSSESFAQTISENKTDPGGNGRKRRANRRRYRKEENRQ